MDQKNQFVSEYLRDSFSFTELCDRYGIGRKTGYNWIDRYRAEGAAGLAAAFSSTTFTSGSIWTLRNQDHVFHRHETL